MPSRLRNQTILFVYGEIDHFVVELHQALDQAGADAVIARTPRDATTALARFDFDGALVNFLQGTDEHQELLRALGGVPTLLLCSPLTSLAAFATFPILARPVAVDAVLTALARLVRPARCSRDG
jgi:hypothetical protein